MVVNSSRVDTLIQLTRLRESTTTSVDPFIDRLLNGDPYGEVIADFIHSVYSEDFIDWSQYIVHKPVYATLTKIVNNEITSHAIILKAITSLLTQIFIRYEKNDAFPLELLKVRELSGIVGSYVDSKELDLSRIKTEVKTILTYINEARESNEIK